jgi:oxygen-independent coproporphyrinogen-3 oxidase
MNITSLLRIWVTRSFKPFEFTNRHDDRLDFEGLKELGLYVHIPFCRSICSFCPYCKVVYDKELAEEYLGALLSEIELVGRTMSGPKEVTSLYFGGGTPALMLDRLGEIISALKKHFVIREGIGVELHPEDVRDDTLDKLKAAGVTMISIGVQSFDPGCLSALGRSEPDCGRIFDAVMKAGFETVDIDLIFAIPGQTAGILKNDIETAFSNGATQISTYPFIDFTFADNRYKPLPEKEKKRMLSEITAFCAEMGCQRTSVWTFARPGTEKYSSITRDNFLGFGVSATTLLKEQFKINTFSIEGYIKRVAQGQLPTSLTLAFSLRQRAAYYLFWSAYSMRISPERFQSYFGRSLDSMYGAEIKLCRMLGLLKRAGDDYELTEKGAYYYHYIEQAYTTAYIDRMWNISRNEPFPVKIILK